MEKGGNHIMTNRFTDPHPRFIKSDPWASVDDKINELIDKVILDFSPETLDDDIPDLLDDWDNRENAIEILIDKLQKMKGSK